MRYVMPVTIMRGGTSKGVFVRQADFIGWDDAALRDRIIKALMGTPDPMQIDGLGGTHSSTSKVMVVGPGLREGIDLEYTFVQVGIDLPIVDYRGNCGNLTAAVTPFALAEGLTRAQAPLARVMMWNANTRKRILAEVPYGRAGVVEEGDFQIDGVPGSGAPITTHFYEPAGSVTGRLFPTSRPRDAVRTSRGEFEVSIVDVTNPFVFVRAADLELDCTELSSAVNANPEILALLEEIREQAAVLAGIHADSAAAAKSNMPAIGFVAPPRDYVTVGGARITAGQVDLLGRVVSVRRVHHAYAGTGAMCTAAAARLAGTIPHEVAAARGNGGRVTIGHSKGTVSAGVEIGSGADGRQTVTSVSIARTARRIMRGEAYIYLR